MKSRFLICTVALLGVTLPSCSKPAPQDDPLAGQPQPSLPKELRILAIGNSFSSDAVEQNLWELFDAEGVEVIIGNLFAPGSYLSHHYNRAMSQVPEYKYVKVTDGKAVLTEGVAFDTALLDEKWDIISLQQASDISGVYKSYYPFLPDLMEYISGKTGASLVFHQTWAYPAGSPQEAFSTYGNDQMTMYQAIMSATKKVVEENGIQTVIPSGTAIQNARTSRLGDTLNRDGLHLELTYGRYIAACTWFEALTGKNVVGNRYYPSGLPPELAKLCQTAAHLACQTPYAVTTMTDFQ